MRSSATRQSSAIRSATIRQWCAAGYRARRGPAVSVHESRGSTRRMCRSFLQPSIMTRPVALGTSPLTRHPRDGSRNGLHARLKRTPSPGACFGLLRHAPKSGLYRRQPGLLTTGVAALDRTRGSPFDRQRLFLGRLRPRATWSGRELREKLHCVQMKIARTFHLYVACGFGPDRAGPPEGGRYVQMEHCL